MRSWLRPATARGSNWIEPSRRKTSSTPSGPPTTERAGASICRATRKRRAVSAATSTARHRRIIGLRMMGAEEGHVAFRGYRTGYRVVGDRNSGAVPLLALHGGPGSTHNYFEPLERLADTRPVVVYDQIGCGKSDRPTDIDWSVEAFREEVDAVRDQLELDRIHLLGTSWGGMLALEHVLAGATGIVSLILSSTLADIDEWAQEQRRLLREMGLEPVSAEDADHERIE